MTRSITFPKTSGDTWTNRETSMEIHLDNGVYTVHVPLQAGGGFLVSGDLRTLNAARDFAKTYVAGTVRPLIAKAYAEALGEHIDRTERRAVVAGVPTWRLDAARRMREYGTSAPNPRNGAGWFASVLNDIRRVEESIERSRRAGLCTAKVNSAYPHAFEHDENVAADLSVTPGYDTCGMTEDEHAEYTPDVIRHAEFRAATYQRAARNALYRSIPIDMSIADRELIDEAHEEAAEMIAAEIDRVYHLTDDSDRPEHERFAGIARLIRQAKRYHLEGRHGKAIMYARTAERMFVVKNGRRRDDAHAEAVACLIS